MSLGPSSQNQVEVIVFQDPRKKQNMKEPPAPPALSVSLWTQPWSFYLLSPFWCFSSFSFSSEDLLADVLIMCVRMFFCLLFISSRPHRNQRRRRVIRRRNSTWKRWHMITISRLSQVKMSPYQQFEVFWRVPQARLEVHRFGITGFRKEQQRVFEQDRAIMLGARVSRRDGQRPTTRPPPGCAPSVHRLLIVSSSAAQEGVCQLQNPAAANQREETESKGGRAASKSFWSLAFFFFRDIRFPNIKCFFCRM